VVVPDDAPVTPESLKALFERDYANQFGRVIPALSVEVLNWTLRLSAPEPRVEPCPPETSRRRITSKVMSEIVDPASGQSALAETHARADLVPGNVISGPALIIEDETTTFVAANYDAHVNARGYIVMNRS
jgi:N-methylhydantoinase A